MPWPVSTDINNHDQRLIEFFSNHSSTAFDISIQNTVPLFIDDSNLTKTYLPTLSLLSI